jgi:hypothetical protein
MDEKWSDLYVVRTPYVEFVPENFQMSIRRQKWREYPSPPGLIITTKEILTNDTSLVSVRGKLHEWQAPKNFGRA